MLQLDLKDKVVLVTGSSRGIGRACALAFADAGALLAINYLSAEVEAEATATAVRERGVKALVVQADVAVKADVDRMFQRIDQELGPLDVLVANAGIWKEASIEQMSDDAWQEMLRINLTSVFLCARAAAGRLRESGGNMVLISSTAGQRGEAHHSHYAAGKGGVISFTKSLAAELGPAGVRVNCVAPGWVDTDMCTEALASPGTHQAVTQQIPLARIPPPEDIAGPVVFLASPLAAHINGEVLNVNGGSVLCG